MSFSPVQSFWLCTLYYGETVLNALVLSKKKNGVTEIKMS